MQKSTHQRNTKGNDFTRKDWLFLAAALSAPFLTVLDTFIFNVAVPSIHSEFRTNEALVQLIISGYILSYVTFLITGGRLGDNYGRRKVYILGTLFFCAVSLFGAFANNPVELIGVRFLQGVAGAMMYPQALSLIQTRFDAQARTKALSFFGATLGLALIMGQLAGGLIIQANILGLSWRPIFLVNLPLGLLTIAMAYRYIENSKAKLRQKLDPIGVILLTVVLLSLVFCITMGRELRWPTWMWLLFLIATLSASIFAWHEKRLSALERSPLLHFDLLKIRSLVIGIFSTTFFYAGQVSFTLLLTLYLQHALKMQPFIAGLTFALVAAGFFLSSLTSPHLLKDSGKRTPLLGLALAGVGTLILGTLVFSSNDTLHKAYLFPTLFLIGTGYGLIIPSLIGIILKNVPPHYAGSASGLLVSVQQLAGVIGVTVVGIPFFNALGDVNVSHYGLAYGSTLQFNVGLFMFSGLMLGFLND